MSEPFRACVRAIPRGASILLSAACATSVGIDQEIADDSDRLTGSRIWSGLLLSDYAFTDAPHRDRLRYGTWHVARSLRELAATGQVDYYPIRASHVIDFIRRKEANDVVVIQVAPPDKDGYCSLGVSGSYCYAAASSARMLILHVNARMPRARGCRVKLTDAAVVITGDQDLAEHAPGLRDETSARIAASIEPLIRDGATLQIGLGSVPEAVLETLVESDRRELAIWGMATDGVVTLDEAGKLRGGPGPAVHAHDVMGTRRLFDWIHENERFRLVDYDVGASVEAIGRIPNFVAINSAIEMDLFGDANAEVLNGYQISGVGGSLDFADGARRSPGGVSILALPATARGGTVSRIVPQLSGVPHSIARTAVQYVVTEYGAADLSLLSLHERAEALIGLAAPDFRDHLWEQYRRSVKVTTSDT
jgi:4-hydroxybutyrate CoA-transferase